VSAILFAAAVGIAIEAVQEIVTPHHAPAPFTLGVLLGVMLIKEIFFRVVRRVADRSKSSTIEADAWHHRADAITSLAAFIGISVALLKGPGWESADDYAALLAAAIITYNAYHLAQAPLKDLLDTQHDTIGDQVRLAATEVPEIKLVEKVFARRSGTRFFVDMHLWVDGDMTVREAHWVAHRAKDRVLQKVPELEDVLIHIEPADPRGTPPEP
jgi:cation diffusion facilitator family transporter